MFSARYGNIYTVLHLAQLIERAFGDWQPQERFWTFGDRFIDPFRPSIDPDGFATIDELEQARTAHLAAVKQTLEQADVFIFTLGLTEGWVNRADGAAYPICPGCGYGTFDPSKYEFRNFTVGEIVESLEYVLGRLRDINPNLRIILTVSPVPLAATMEDRHVLLSTVLSKSVLRTACDAIVKKYPNVDYFGSYEIVNYGREMSTYFEGDLRSVSDDGIDHVMEVFFRHYCGEEIAAGNKFEQSVCDEDLLIEGAKSSQIAVKRSGEGGSDLPPSKILKLAGNDLKKYGILPQRTPHPATVWRGKPNVVTASGKKLDNLGFHNRKNIADFMAPHHRRVCVVGNSVVMEVGLEPEEAIVGHLQTELTKRSFGQTFVYNCGIEAVVSSQDVSNLLHNVIDMKPSVVVVMSGGTDMAGAMTYDPRPGYPCMFYVWQIVLESFRLERKSGYLSAELVPFESPLDSLRKELGYMSGQWLNAVHEKFRSNMIKIARLCDGFNIPCIIINQPTHHSLKLDRGRYASGAVTLKGEKELFEYDAMVRSHMFGQLERTENSSNAVFVDFSAIFDHLSESPYTDRLHLNPSGCALMAQAISNIITKKFASAIA